MSANDIPDRLHSCKIHIWKALDELGAANELIYRIAAENVEAANESLCRAISELKGCLKAL